MLGNDEPFILVMLCVFLADIESLGVFFFACCHVDVAAWLFLGHFFLWFQLFWLGLDFLG